MPAQDFRLAEDCPANPVARHSKDAAMILLLPGGDLNRLGIGERNSAKPKARQGRASGKRASHWVRVRGSFSLPILFCPNPAE